MGRAVAGALLVPMRWRRDQSRSAADDCHSPWPDVGFSSRGLRHRRRRHRLGCRSLRDQHYAEECGDYEYAHRFYSGYSFATPLRLLLANIKKVTANSTKVREVASDFSDLTVTSTRNRYVQ